MFLTGMDLETGKIIGAIFVTCIMLFQLVALILFVVFFKKVYQGKIKHYLGARIQEQRAKDNKYNMSDEEYEIWREVKAEMQNKKKIIAEEMNKKIERKNKKASSI